MKYFMLSFIAFMLVQLTSVAQKDSFTTIPYSVPLFFLKGELPSSVQFSLKNNNSNVLVFNLYKNKTKKKGIIKDIASQWNGLPTSNNSYKPVAESFSAQLHLIK